MRIIKTVALVRGNIILLSYLFCLVRFLSGQQHLHGAGFSVMIITISSVHSSPLWPYGFTAGRPCDFKHQSGLVYGADIVNKVVDVVPVDRHVLQGTPTRQVSLNTVS